MNTGELEIADFKGADSRPLHSLDIPTKERLEIVITSDGEHPSEEDILHLRRVCGKIPWTAYTVGFVELCERFSYYGTTAVCMQICIHSVYQVSNVL